MKPGTSQKKPKSGKQNCRKQKLLESDIAKQNGPILTRKTATTKVQLYNPLSSNF
jgi:hypothetical protein